MIKNRIMTEANWGSHLPMLIKAFLHTKGPVLELGCGDFSTPVLHELCAYFQRSLLSADSDLSWIDNFKDLENSWHKFIYIPVFETKKNSKLELWNSIPLQDWGMIFVDHAPIRRRVDDIARFKDHAQIIVVHDYEKIDKEIFNEFKYKYVYERYVSQTILISNVINLSAIFAG